MVVTLATPYRSQRPPDRWLRPPRAGSERRPDAGPSGPAGSSARPVSGQVNANSYTSHAHCRRLLTLPPNAGFVRHSRAGYIWRLRGATRGKPVAAATMMVVMSQGDSRKPRRKYTVAQARNLMRRAIQEIVDPSPASVDPLWDYLESRCAYCDVLLVRGERDAHTDHAERDGGNHLGNLANSQYTPSVLRAALGWGSRRRANSPISPLRQAPRVEVAMRYVVARVRLSGLVLLPLTPSTSAMGSGADRSDCRE